MISLGYLISKFRFSFIKVHVPAIDQFYEYTIILNSQNYFKITHHVLIHLFINSQISLKRWRRCCYIFIIELYGQRPRFNSCLPVSTGISSLHFPGPLCPGFPNASSLTQRAFTFFHIWFSQNQIFQSS